MAVHIAIGAVKILEHKILRQILFAIFLQIPNRSTDCANPIFKSRQTEIVLRYHSFPKINFYFNNQYLKCEFFFCIRDFCSPCYPWRLERLFHLPYAQASPAWARHVRKMQFSAFKGEIVSNLRYKQNTSIFSLQLVMKRQKQYLLTGKLTNNFSQKLINNHQHN